MSSSAIPCTQVLAYSTCTTILKGLWAVMKGVNVLVKIITHKGQPCTAHLRYILCCAHTPLLIAHGALRRKAEPDSSRHSTVVIMSTMHTYFALQSYNSSLQQVLACFISSGSPRRWAVGLNTGAAKVLGDWCGLTWVHPQGKSLPIVIGQSGLTTF